jgi:hypothetical protein
VKNLKSSRVSGSSFFAFIAVGESSEPKTWEKGQTTDRIDFFWVGLSAEHVPGRIYRFKACHVRKRNRHPAAGKKPLVRKFRPAPRNLLPVPAARLKRCIRPSPPSARSPTPKNLCHLWFISYLQSHPLGSIPRIFLLSISRACWVQIRLKESRSVGKYSFSTAVAESRLASPIKTVPTGF